MEDKISIEKDIDNRLIEAEKILREKIETIYQAFDIDRDYLTSFDLYFPQENYWYYYEKHQPLDENPIRLDTMFEYFEIEENSIYQSRIIEPTGSLLQKELSKLERQYYLKKEYMEVLESITKYNFEVMSFTYQIEGNFDSIIVF